MAKKGKKLTVIGVERVKPGAVRREIGDTEAAGLRLVVQPSGVKSWVYRYRFGKPCKLTLGRVIYIAKGEPELEPVLGGGLTLIGARKVARNAANDLAKGVDPATAKKPKPEPAPPTDGDLFKDVVEKFAKRYLADKKSGAETKRLLVKNVVPEWGAKKIQDIRRRDVIELIDKLGDRGLHQGATRILAAARKLYNWADERGMFGEEPPPSPFRRIKAPAKEVIRDRVLRDDEVCWFWRACDKAGFPFGDLHKLLLLTGARLREVAEMTWGELDLTAKVWNLPGSRTKNGKPHSIPLNSQALAIIDGLKKVKNKPGFLFCTNGESPVSGFSKAKQHLDAAMTALAREETGDPEKMIPGWWAHDLRRSCATGMARLSIGLPVIEKALNHKIGSLAGVGTVVANYVHEEYADPKRAAFEKWGAFVERLTSGTGDNVRELRRPA